MHPRLREEYVKFALSNKAHAVGRLLMLWVVAMGLVILASHCAIYAATTRTTPTLQLVANPAHTVNHKIAGPVIRIGPIMFRSHSVESKLLNGNVGYIRIDNMDYPFDVDDVRRAMHKLGPCDAYVIDLRECRYGNLDGAVGITSLFLDQGTVTSITVRTPPYTGDTYVTYRLHPTAVEIITWTPPTTTGTAQYFIDYKPREFNLSTGRPVYILTRGRTSHAAEIFCAALRDNRRATLLGVPTHGNATVPVVVQDAYRRTTVVYDGIFYSPNRQCIGSGVISCSGGLQPDVFVRPDPGIQYGTNNDNQLNEALHRLGK